MADDSFRDINDLTSEEIVGQEIDAIMYRKAVIEQKRREEEANNKEAEKPKEPVLEVTEEDKVPPKKEPETKKETAKEPKKAATNPKAKKKTTKKKAAAPAKKSKPKKSKPKTVVVDEEDLGSKWLTIIVSAIAILAVIIGAYFIFNPGTTQTQSDTVAVVVNGEPIYNSDIDMRQSLIQRTENPFVTREGVINQTIDQRLLVQEAKRKGIQVSSADVANAIQTTLTNAGITPDEFQTEIESANITYEFVEKFYEENLYSFLLINETILNNISVSEEEIQTYYDENQEQFIVPKMAQVRHILITFGNETEEETFARATEISEEITSNRDNFCELVEDYTDDKASSPTCGEYNFTESDPLVPEFLEAGFSMSPDEIKIVKTQFGYHIIWKIADIPKKTLELEDVSTFIRTTIENEKTIDLYLKLIDELKADSIIELYTEEPEEVLPIFGEKEENKTEPIKETVVTNESKKQSLAKCLNKLGAKMYTVYWSPDNEAQLDIFGDEAGSITVIECDADGKNPKLEECEELNVKVYPSWVIDDKLYEGLQSSKKLAAAGECII